MNHLRSGVRDQPGQHGETMSTKNIKISLWGSLPCEAPRKWALPYSELEPGHRSPVGGVELRESRNRQRDYVILNN